MNPIYDFICTDKTIRSELRKQILAGIKSDEFGEIVRRKMAEAFNSEINSAIDTLLDDVWMNLQNQISKELSKNFIIALTPKDKS